jgi:hypothetical protein
MTVRIKEVVLRYEDDGQQSKLSPEEYKKKFAPLSLNIHHHCAPPPQTGQTRVEIDTSDQQRGEKEVVIPVVPPQE